MHGDASAELESAVPDHGYLDASGKLADDPPQCARDGTPVDPDTARVLIHTAFAAVYQNRLAFLVRSLTSGTRPLDRPPQADAEDAASDAFAALLTTATANPYRWLTTADEVAWEEIFPEWRIAAQRELYAKERQDAAERRAAREAAADPADSVDTAAAVAVVAPAAPPPPLRWAVDMGVDLAKVFGTGELAMPSNVLSQLALLRWWSGIDPASIAAELTALSGVAVDQAEVFVRLVRQFRVAPWAWMAGAAHCQRALNPSLVVGAQRTRSQALAGDVWRDPFHPTRRDHSVALLVNWMAATRRLHRQPDRVGYEWAVEDTRQVVALRIATGLAGSVRTLQRGRLWASPEPFARIAESLPSGRRVAADAVRKHFERTRAENPWLEPLLPTHSLSVGGAAARVADEQVGRPVSGVAG